MSRKLGNESLQGLEVLFPQFGNAYFFAQLITIDIASHIDNAPMHPGAYVIGFVAFPLFQIEAEEDQDAACHIFAEEVLCGAPDDEHWLLIMVLLHVDACTVAHIISDENLASTG